MRRRQSESVIVLLVCILLLMPGIVPAFEHIQHKKLESLREVIDDELHYQKAFSLKNNIHLSDVNSPDVDHYRKHALDQPLHSPTTIYGEEWDIVVPDDYSSIQQAINNAEEGYRIFVRDGVYHENIEIDYVSSITLHGELKETTIIDGSGTDNIIEIEDSADGINVSGFTIRNSGDTNQGILVSSNYNIILDNIFENNNIGIKIKSSSGNQIWNNNIIDNSETGILLDRSYANNITENLIKNNGNNGIKFTYSSLGTTLDNNQISNHNENGVYLDESSLGNMFTRCTIKENEYGVLCAGVSDGNIFQQNAFLSNTVHAFDSSLDQWDYHGLGNFWDDYDGVDVDGDGIGDTPYDVPGGDNVDRYPIMNQALMYNDVEHEDLITENNRKDYCTFPSTSSLNIPGEEIIVPDDYSTIQEAINHADSGDSIFVRSGTYAEHILISTPDLTIYGEDKETTFIDGGGENHVVFVNEHADGLSISGFTIRSSGKHFTGLYLYSDSTVLEDVIFTDCNIGVALRDNTDNMIRDCEFENNNYGIWTWMSSNNTFENNTIKNNILDGMAIQWSTDLNITGNDIATNSFNGVLELSCVNITSNSNDILDNAEFGIQIFSSIDNGINENRINQNERDGISLYKSKRNAIVGNTIYNNEYNGISFHFFSSSNTITSNTITDNNYVGIGLYYSSDNNSITNNTIDNNEYGISLSSSSDNNAITSNTIDNNEYGISLSSSSDNNAITENTIDNNRVGIQLSSSSDNNITSNTITDNNWDGICLYFSSDNNSITGNIITDNKWCGILLQSSSDNNAITENTITDNNYYGIVIYSYSDNNSVTNNTITDNNWDGICLSFSSDNNSITNNTITDNNGDGICLSFSSDNTIINNDFQSNGITIDGDDIEHWNSHIIENNYIINRGPIRYYKNTNEVIVPNDTAQVILANCKECIIQNLNLSNGETGIQLRYSSDNTITENAITDNNRDGICLYFSSDNNSITNNTIDNNEVGIWLEDSSDNNSITNNTIDNNFHGIILYDSSNRNIIRNNNFIGNNNQAYFEDTTMNFWFGNYWDDWPGIIPKPILGFIHFFNHDVIWLNFDWHPASEPYDIGD